MPSDNNRRVKPLILAGSPVRTSLGVRRDGGRVTRQSKEKKDSIRKSVESPSCASTGNSKKMSAFQSTTKTNCRISSESEVEKIEGDSCRVDR